MRNAGVRVALGTLVALDKRPRPPRQLSAQSRKADPPAAGPAGPAAWLARLGLQPATPHWFAAVVLDVLDAPAPMVFETTRASRLHVRIEHHGWIFFFCHQGSSSEIEIGTVVKARVRDDFNLVRGMRPLERLDELVRDLEQSHSIAFKRDHAMVRSDIDSAEPIIRKWVRSL